MASLRQRWISAPRIFTLSPVFPLRFASMEIFCSRTMMRFHPMRRRRSATLSSMSNNDNNSNAIIVQQEVLTDTHSFDRALVHILRQDPDVIVVGEMRDHETISAALTAAETGHLVLATMHSPNVTHAFERIVGVFEGSAQRQIILQLSNGLQGIVAQELLPAADRTRRVLAYELIVVNSAVRNLIRENQLHL